jgi:hypothetical protein
LRKPAGPVTGVAINGLHMRPFVAVDLGVETAGRGQWRRRLAPSWPAGGWSRADSARVVAWLCSRESAWATVNVVDAEGGLRRRAGDVC